MIAGRQLETTRLHAPARVVRQLGSGQAGKPGDAVCRRGGNETRTGGPEWPHANCRQLAAKAGSDWQWRCSCAGSPAFSAAVTSATSSRRRRWSRRPRSARCENSAWPISVHCVPALVAVALVTAVLIRVAALGAFSRRPLEIHTARL